MNGIFSASASRSVASRSAGVLRRRGLVRDEVGPQRLDHQPLRGGHLAQPREVVAAERAEVRVREDPALQRALAGPRDVADEVVEAELGEPLADARVVARVVAGEDQQLLDVAARGAVDQRLDLVGRVQVRLMRRERAVLAVRHARARQRQRDVARERDPAAHPRRDTTEAAAPAGSGGDQVQQRAALELRRRRRSRPAPSTRSASPGRASTSCAGARQPMISSPARNASASRPMASGSAAPTASAGVRGDAAARAPRGAPPSRRAAPRSLATRRVVEVAELRARCARARRPRARSPSRSRTTSRSSATCISPTAMPRPERRVRARPGVADARHARRPRRRRAEPVDHARPSAAPR